MYHCLVETNAGYADETTILDRAVTFSPQCKQATPHRSNDDDGLGLPLGMQRDWLSLIAPHVDLAKLVVGTARLYEEQYLLDKLALYEEHAITPFLGGQFLEYVFETQGMPGVQPFCDEAKRLGIGAIEVSDNVVPLTDHERKELIRIAIDCGLEVHGEVGSKSDDSGAEALVSQAEMCFEAGADVVLVEGAELLRNSQPNDSLIEGLRAGLELDRVIFELSGTWIPGLTIRTSMPLSPFWLNVSVPTSTLPTSCRSMFLKPKHYVVA